METRSFVTKGEQAEFERSCPGLIGVDVLTEVNGCTVTYLDKGELTQTFRGANLKVAEALRGQWETENSEYHQLDFTYVTFRDGTGEVGYIVTYERSLVAEPA